MKLSIDIQLIISTSIILVLGSLIHFGLDFQQGVSHLVFIFVGLLASALALFVDYKIIPAFRWHGYVFILLMLILTLVTGVSTRGSTRWVDLGFLQFQPSELAKPVLILILARIVAYSNLSTWREMFRVLAVMLTPIILVFMQPDLGSAVVLAAIAGAIFLGSNVPVRFVLVLIATALILSPLGWFSLQSYQKNRVATFLNPTADPLGRGYNSIQSLIAVGSGQLTGKGLGHGTQSQLRFLPENQTDFIFASLAEELGFIGSLILILAYTWLIMRLFYLSKNASEVEDSLSLLGITAMFAIQTIINIGMNIGLLPVTGITLPLVSLGGTSMVVSLATIAMAMKLALQKQKTSGIEISISRK